MWPTEEEGEGGGKEGDTRTVEFVVVAAHVYYRDGDGIKNLELD